MKGRHAIVGLVLLLAAACGDSGGETTTTPPTAPATAAPTTPPTVTTTTLPPETTTTVATTVAPASDVSVSIRSIGPVRIGMTVSEAEDASGLTLVGEPDPTISENCYFVAPDGAPGYEGVSFIVVDDRIGRVDIDPPSTITTRSGAGIGSTEQELRDLFPGQIEDAAEFIVDGRAVMFVPQDEVDEDYRVIFELDEQSTVARFRSGVLPPVGFGEGCA